MRTPIIANIPGFENPSTGSSRQQHRQLPAPDLTPVPRSQSPDPFARSNPSPQPETHLLAAHPTPWQIEPGHDPWGRAAPWLSG